MSSMHKCPECGLVFENHSKKANHIKWHHRATQPTIEKIKAIRHQQRGHLVTEIRQCKKCSQPFEVSYYSNTKRPPKKECCSKICANSRVQTDAMKLKKSATVKKRWQEGVYDEVQRVKVEGSKLFSSKTERVIRDYIKRTYPEGMWKCGGSLLIDGSRISRDLYSDKLKICFEYDGVWHFKDIHGQLQHKQEVDRKLESWCIANSYRLIRVDEDAYVDIHQVVKLIYERNDPVIKIGTRY